MTAASTRERDADDIEQHLNDHQARGNIRSWQRSSYEPRRWTATLRDGVDMDLRTTREASRFIAGMRSAAEAALARYQAIERERDRYAALAAQLGVNVNAEEYARITSELSKEVR